MQKLAGKLRGQGTPEVGQSDDEDPDMAAVDMKHLWKNYRLLPPSSPFKARWDMMMLAFVLYNCTYIPLEMAFQIQTTTGHKVFDYLVDACFWVDIVLNFRTCYEDDTFMLVTNRKQIRDRYLHSWFPLDFVATFPFEIFTLMGMKFNATVFGIFKMPRLLRLGRLLKQLDQMAAANAFRVVKLLAGFLLFAHWIACGWWGLGASEMNLNNDTGDSWLRRTPGYLRSPPINLELENADLEQKYMSALYWSLTMLMKTPYVGPDTVPEKVFGCCACVVGAIMFAALLGNVTAMIQSFDKSNAQFRDMMTTLTTFAKHRRIPAGIQSRMFRYVESNWAMTLGIDDQQTLGKLPKTTQGNILLQIHADLILESPLLKVPMSNACLRMLLMNLQSEVCLQKETLMNAGNVCRILYILARGSLEISLPQAPQGSSAGGGRQMSRSASSKAWKTQLARRIVERKGYMVGFNDPYNRCMVWRFNVEAVKKTELFKITQSSMARILGMFKADSEAICGCLMKEHRSLCDYLKPRNKGKGTEDQAEEEPEVVSKKSTISISRKNEKALPEMRERVRDLEERLETCLGAIGQIKQDTSVLPQILADLQEAVGVQPSEPLDDDPEPTARIQLTEATEDKKQEEDNVADTMMVL